MALPYFSQHFLDWLRKSISDNLDLYKVQDFPDYVQSQAAKVKGAIREADVTMEPPALESSSGTPRFDSENVRLVYSQLKYLTDTQATDERLWTHMTHTTSWEYMRTRWGLNDTTAKDKTNFVRERYFVKTSNSRWLIRNGMARLWWFGRLTYTHEDQWELTDVLLSLQDVQSGLLERSYGKNPVILHCALRLIAEYRKELEDAFQVTYGQNKKGYQHFCRYIGLLGGTTLLDTLSSAQIESLIKQKFLRPRQV